ncbi:hypothetical protein D3C80_1777080 [compost metagenome]
MAFAQLFGIAQGSPGVVQSRAYGALQLFAKGQATGQGAGQGATRAVVAARQALASPGMTLTVAAVQAIVDFVLVTVTAGDQQVSDKRQQFFCALVRRAFRQFSQDARFGQVRGSDGCQW